MALPIKVLSAPKATAFKMSCPDLIPPSSHIADFPLTASTIFGNIEIVLEV